MAKRKVKSKQKRTTGPGALSFLLNSVQGFILLMLILAVIVTAAMKYKHEIRGFVSDQTENNNGDKISYADTSRIAQLTYQTAINKMNRGQYGKAVSELEDYELIDAKDRSPVVDDLAAKAKAMCSRIDNAWNNIYTLKQVNAQKMKDIHFENGFILRAEYNKVNLQSQIKTPLGLIVNLDQGYTVKNLDRKAYEIDMKKTLAEDKISMEKQGSLSSKDYVSLAQYAYEQGLLSQAGPLLDKAIKLDKKVEKNLNSSASANYVHTGVWYASVGQVKTAKSFFNKVHSIS